HGPGSLHVAARRSQSYSFGDVDRTIVHPHRLPRELQEAICAQCHLDSAAEAEVRGRTLRDFRPGLPLRDFQIVYGLATPDKSMKVVGHVEQLHLSRCYQASRTLTCATCHDPHAGPSPSERMEYFREKCLACHSTEACRLPRPQRLK